MPNKVDIIDSSKSYVTQNSNIEIFGVSSQMPAIMYDAMGDYIENGWELEEFNTDAKIKEWIYSRFILVKIEEDEAEELRSKFKLESNGYYAEFVDEDIYVPECVGNFKHEWNNYAILFPRNGTNGATHPERGIYKGCIVQPSLYYSDKAQWVVDENAWRTGDILRGE